MKRSRRKFEELLWILGVHAPMRKLYSATFAKQHHRRRQAVRAFYEKIVPKDSLVFDIGANVGAFSYIFASLGSRVIALEPNPDCLRHIELSYSKFNIVPVNAAVGPMNGITSLNVSDIHDDNSSLSAEWMLRMESTYKSYKDVWNRTISVPLLTLNSLIDHFGLPYFIKIDVEGYEEQVLDGLSHQPPLLSFEFNRIYLESALRCLDKPVFRPDSMFNVAFGDPTLFELETWVDRADLVKFLSTLPDEHLYGDIFVSSPYHCVTHPKI